MNLADYMEKADYTEQISAGDIVVFTEDGKVTKLNGSIADVNRIAGIVSDINDIGLIIGGNGLQPNERVPVVLTGRVYLKTGGLDVQSGDLIALGENGELKIVSDYSRAVLGKAVKHSEDGSTLIIVR